jgi:hypothetical protein
MSFKSFMSYRDIAMNLLDLARSAIGGRDETRPPARSLPLDSGVERRRNRALALLDAEPTRLVAVVAESGDPAHVAIAIRGAAVGELEIAPERYDGFALLALMNQYGHA